MSAIISQTKTYYRRALMAFFVLLSVISVAVVWINLSVAISFFSGSLASFLPFCLSVYWVFFRQRENKPIAVAEFYKAEGLKWGLTIILVIMSFKLLPVLHYLAFFAGYLFALLGSIVLPLWSKRSATK